MSPTTSPMPPRRRPAAPAAGRSAWPKILGALLPQLAQPLPPDEIIRRVTAAAQPLERWPSLRVWLAAAPPPPASLAGRACSTGSLQWASADPPATPDDCALAVPLKFGEALLGVLEARGPRRRSLPSAERAFFQSLADLTALALHNARAGNAQLVQLKRLYATLSQVNQMIVMTQERAALFQAVCEVVVRDGEMAEAWVGLWDEPANAVRPAAAHGLALAELPVVNLQPDQPAAGLLAAALHSGRVVTSDPARLDPQTAASALGRRALAVIPLTQHGRSIGVLVITAAEAGFFQDAEEMRLLAEIGGDLSYALDRLEAEAERAAAERAVREREQKLSRLLEIIPIGVSILDHDHRVVYSNPALQTMTALTPAELAGGSYSQRAYIASDGTPLSPEAFPSWRARQTGQPVPATEIGILAGGARPRWTSVSATPVGFPDWAVIVTTVDITDRRQAEAERLAATQVLAETNTYLRQLFQQSAVAKILNRASDRTIVECNAQAEQMFGYAAAELIGRSTNSLDIWVDPGERQKVADLVIQHGAVQGFEFQYRTKAGASG